MPAFTSDGKERPNMAQLRALVSVPIPTSIGLSARVGVLNDLGEALVAAGATLNVIDRSASYDQSTVTQRINDISNAANGLGATPTLPIYSSTDYNAFTSIINNIGASIAAIP